MTTKQSSTEIPYQAIIDDLNAVLGKTGRRRIRLTGDVRKAIRARFTDGFDLEDFQHVHRIKFAEWGGDPEWDGYLHPDTLYRQSKFPKYVAQERVKQTLTLEQRQTMEAMKVQARLQEQPKRIGNNG